jgi:hypothetical protein
MPRNRLLTLLVIGCLVLVGGSMALFRAWHTPPAWRDLQRWAATAEPGTLYHNPELGPVDGRVMRTRHTQDAPMPFLYSDSPEYLYADAVGKGLASMRLTVDRRYREDPRRRLPFGVGIYHINKTVDAGNRPRTERLQVVVRLLKDVDGARNTRPATVILRKSARGLSAVMPVLAGKACARTWFAAGAQPPRAFTLRPGEAAVVYSVALAPDTCINAMLDLEADNAGFLKVYTTWGTVRDMNHLAFAPYGMTIGTNSGTGSYWKRRLEVLPGTRPFDAADTRHANKVQLPVVKAPPSPEMQYLVDETWNLRPENGGKVLVRSKGGQRRPFKGDYNVEYAVTIPVRNRSNRPATFALVDQQRFGLFGGAMRTPGGRVVAIPAGDTTLIRVGSEGVLLDRVTVPPHTSRRYTFRWMLSGGSYGDQVFTLIPLPPPAAAGDR